MDLRRIGCWSTRMRSAAPTTSSSGRMRSASASSSPRVSPAIVKQYDLHTWYFGDLAPANDTYRRPVPAAVTVLRWTASGGAEAHRGHVPGGLFSGRPGRPTAAHGRHASPTATTGFWPDNPDYYGIDDFTEIWWDPTATGEDEIAQGRHGHDAVRRTAASDYFLGAWTSDLNVFDQGESQSSSTTQLPAAETPPTYPPPPGSPAASAGS